uniref:Protein kinase domain-containing protein n=1 Tax=Coccolithus braarudii TaxID=221442 RepID=A0A7S0LPI3_9EUKA|mmetsp:Transcript_51626/g.110285  ORF Transcript_51626/g.110285 Transcript_51626/m.110285 type:complete len:412 (+) Transcript_51626:35-1270(+)
MRRLLPGKKVSGRPETAPQPRTTSNHDMVGGASFKDKNDPNLLAVAQSSASVLPSSSDMGADNRVTGASKTAGDPEDDRVEVPDKMGTGSRPSSGNLHDPMPQMEQHSKKKLADIRRLCEGDLSERVYLGKGEFCIAERTHLGNCMVAIKRLRPDREGDEAAQRDLGREIQLMASMDHPHVLSVIGVGWLDNKLPFMCLELLSTVLSRELPKSVEEVPFWTRQRSVKKWPLQRAIHIGVGIAKALNYCHNEFSDRYRILHRDLKPANIGFMPDNRVVVFDFGVCSFWDKNESTEQSIDAPRPLTGLTGSMRYMAPEVALEQPYNYKAEAFSFASVLWEMASHTRPFEWMDSSLFIEYACKQGVRCKMGKAWPDELKQLITSCWSTDIDERPDFLDIVPRLERIESTLTTKK